jgi:hypothetical protein
MILSYSYYDFPLRKGIVFFHQKTWTSGGQSALTKIFKDYFSTIEHITQDQDSTRIQSEDDLGDTEIQLLESAKIRTLRGLPQNSLYWGSEMFFAHAAKGHLYFKLPKWLVLFRSQNEEFQSLEINDKWSKVETKSDTSIYLTLKTNSSKPFRIMNLKSDTLRLATNFSLPQLECLPLLSLDLRERIKE